VLVTAVGALLLCLAAGDALAGVEFGGGGDNTLRGSAGGDRLAGFNGDDTLHGGAGDDALYGGAGDDEIYGDPGEDDVLGGAGDDFIEVKDGTADRVGCGLGKDSVSVDREDLISPDCESVYPG
jgi:Ca2+-binding RTX toxin-like protein